MGFPSIHPSIQREMGPVFRVWTWILLKTMSPSTQIPMFQRLFDECRLNNCYLVGGIGGIATPLKNMMK